MEYQFKEGDLLRHRMNPAVLVVQAVLSNNRLLVNFHNQIGHEEQLNWEVYEVDCLKITI